MEKKRREQERDWMWFLVREGLDEWFFKNPEIVKLMPVLTREVESGNMTPTSAAARALKLLKNYSYTM